MIDWFLAQDGIVIYGGLLGALLVSVIGFPPEDLCLILGGILIHNHVGNPWIIFVVCYLGIIFGDLVIYYMGSRFAERPKVRHWFANVSPRKIKRIQLHLEKRSILMIFVSRHLIYLRTLTFFTCGMVKMRFTKFLFADAIAALISAPLMITLGYIASDYHHELLDAISKVKWTLLGLGILGLLGYLLYRYKFKTKQVSTDEAQTENETPPVS